jgi:hypothetical protein
MIVLLCHLVVGWTGTPAFSPFDGIHTAIFWNVKYSFDTRGSALSNALAFVKINKKTRIEKSMRVSVLPFTIVVNSRAALLN